MKHSRRRQSGRSTLRTLLILLVLGAGLTFGSPELKNEIWQELTGEEVFQEQDQGAQSKEHGEQGANAGSAAAQTQEIDAEQKAANGQGLSADSDAAEFSQSIVTSAPEEIPEYSGDDVVILHDSVPDFNAYDLTHIQGDHYSDLDELGRCGPAVAMLDTSMMPTQPRGDISMVHPSGWHSVDYPDLIDGGKLYNRSHLIAFSLAGQNANEKNLITGTQHLNQEVMLAYEKPVIRYLEDTTNHVLYRVTPYFKGDELVARGVEMEAYSVEDQGEGIEYHVFLYNVQPGVVIDYATGDSHEE